MVLNLSIVIYCEKRESELNLFYCKKKKKKKNRGRGGSDEFSDRGTMFSQLAKRSIRGLVSGISKDGGMFSHDFNFGFERAVISKELRILSPPAKQNIGGISESSHFVEMFDYFALGKSIKIRGNSTSFEM